MYNRRKEVIDMKSRSLRLLASVLILMMTLLLGRLGWLLLIEPEDYNQKLNHYQQGTLLESQNEQ